MRNKVFYGWKIVAVTWFLYLLMTAPPSYGCSIILTRLVNQSGWDERLVGMCTSVYNIAIAIICVASGLLMRFTGPKKSILFSALVGAVCYGVPSLATIDQHVYPFLFIGYGICSGGALIASSVLVNLWFVRNRAVPMSIIMTSGAIGGFLMPLITAGLLRSSVQVSWMAFGMMAVVSLVLAAVVIQEKPEKIGEVRDGYRWRQKRGIPLEEPEPDVGKPGTSNDGAFRDRNFYALGGMILTARMVMAAFTSYIALHAVQCGLRVERAAVLLSVFSIVGLFGRIASGIADTVPLPRKQLGLLSFAPLILGCLLLSIARSYGSLVFGAALTGFGFGFQNALFPLLVSYYFGDARFPMLYGIYNFLGGLGGFAAPLAVFAVKNRWGSYSAAYLALCVFSCVVCGMFLFLRDPSKQMTESIK